MAALPGWVNEHQRQRLHRSPKNPLDISTIISMYPREVNEKKQMVPERYIIPPGTPEKPSFTIVEGASSWREMLDTGQMVEIPISSVSVAESVIRDWVIGMIEVSMGIRQPAIFFIPGKWDLPTILGNPEMLQVMNRYKELQKAWFIQLVEIGDSLWARSNGNPLAISDLMRMAAEQLGIKDKPWTKNFQAVRMVQCKACGHHVMPGFPVCANCKTVIDTKAFAEMGLKFAAQP